MFALALHARRESERRASEKRRQPANSAANRQRLHQRLAHLALEETSAKHGGQPQSAAAASSDQQLLNGDHPLTRKASEGHLVDGKGRTYPAITVIRIKDNPEEVLAAAGFRLRRSEQDDQAKDQTKGGSNSTSEAPAVLGESGHRVLVLRMSHDQHKMVAARLKRQLTQPDILVPETAPQTEPIASRKPEPLTKKLSK